MKHGTLTLRSIQIAFVTLEFFIQFFKQEVTSECIELMWIHLNFMSFALAYSRGDVQKKLFCKHSPCVPSVT